MKKYILIMGALLLIAAASTAYAQNRIYDAKATGSGLIADGGRATFGFIALYPDGKTEPSGNLQYNDHAAGVKVHGNVESLCVNGNTAIFTGTYKDATGTPVEYTVMAVDNGKPGKNDEFTITLGNGYTKSGTLKGGNIRVSGTDPECEDEEVIIH